MKKDLLRKIPSIATLLAGKTAVAWLENYPRKLVTDCIRDAVEHLRGKILADAGGRCGAMHVSDEYVLAQAEVLLADRMQPHLRGAINATGIILHTGLGRSVWPECVVDSLAEEIKGYVTLAIDRQSGTRSDRDRRVEYILTELTQAEAATVVNNNAAATVLVLAALAAGKEVVVSRGQLIEIGGSFRLPEVMAQSRATLVEVGATNRTHRKDYEAAITENTVMLMRCHPSNFRIVGFASEVPLSEMVEVAHSRNLTVLDDLGAGALVDLADYGLPHEPTVQESIAAGADLVIFSGDKLIGGSQAGIIVGRKDLIDHIRKHPLARAFRPDKTCIMVMERTLQLFRDPGKLRDRHPLYRMLGMPPETLKKRADALAMAIRKAAPQAEAKVQPTVGYLGSGSLPAQQLPSFAVAIAVPGKDADELARRLRLDPAAIFARIEDQNVLLDVRTVTDQQVAAIAAAIGRIVV